MQSSLIYVIQTVTDLYLMTLLFRLVLEFFKADYYNPIAQLIIKITNPIINPFKFIIPRIGNLNTSILFVWILLQSFILWLLLFTISRELSYTNIIFISAMKLINSLISLYTWGIIIHAVLSWFPLNYNPLVALLSQVINPFLSPFRKIIPLSGGIDFSPILALILLNAISIAIPSPNIYI
ncbi:MAG: hypothetical protein CBC38_07800 [Gammaproteobacteria bacterium TMED78]|nr:MAG: hypothetical protein CBC38_07800 [Gammaproteobacteria bacterium TMED78]|tara:strand:- start:161 stop:703 length:543 start_codon:yes stop_codon:yes gene_type:complete